MNADKLFLSANDLLTMSYQLARKIWDDGFIPTHLIGLWRGGTPIAIAIHEFFATAGHDCFHMPVKTQRTLQPDGGYHISVVGEAHFLENVHRDSRILFVDDIFDTGLTMDSLIKMTTEQKGFMPEIRTATIFYKPAQNRTSITPDWYIHKTDAWIIFPHEISKSRPEELQSNKPFLWPYVADIINIGGPEHER